MTTEATLLDRIRALETRIDYLERGTAVGITGTDQTIKGSHDRLDALLGAGGASANLVSGVAIGTYAIHATITKTGIADNTQTSIFTVTTTNESGSTDGGGFVCFCNCLVGHAIASNATDLAIVADHCVMQRINKANGTATSAMGEIWEGGVSASAAATRSIASVTPGQTATSNYVTTMWLTIDLTGTGVTTAQAVVAVELIWWGYLTAPVLAAA